MGTRKQFESMTDVCLAAHEVIKKHGTLEMQNLIRLLLFQIGQELARRQAKEHEVRQAS